jgi:hypothetical protein
MGKFRAYSRKRRPQAMAPETEVRALIEQMRSLAQHGGVNREWCSDAAATLEALLAERDAIADAERDRVVEWLRTQWGGPLGPDYRPAADALARNEHRSKDDAAS